MRIAELLNGITIQITNDEHDVLRKFNKSDTIKKSELTPFEQKQMNQLVQKDLVTRKKIEGKISYVKSK